MEKAPFGNESIESLFERLKTSREGLSQNEADLRLKKFGPNSLNPTKKGNGALLFSLVLAVLRAGIEAGRLTFANTLKYVFMATSANFENVFSMTCASLFLPFLPLLPKQVLLVNLLTDIPEMAIGTDRVDPDRVYKPVKWDLRFIGKFMFVFGLISSIFDYRTFAVLFISSIPFLGFVPLPPLFYWTLAPIVLLYLIFVEIAKRFFFHRRSSS